MTEKKLRTPASPKVRKFARELGVDVNLVSGTQRLGRVIENDIKKFIKEKRLPEKKDEGKKTELEYPHSEFGEIEIKDIPRIKKISLLRF